MRHITALAGGLVLLASAAWAQTPPASGQTLTTATLANVCAATGTEAASATAQGYCRGFIIGVGQYHHEITRPGGARPVFCLPDPAPSMEAAQASFVAWAAANPQHATDRAVDGLLRWAAATYPCPTPAAPARRGAR